MGNYATLCTVLLVNYITTINESIYTGPTAQSKYTFYNDFLPSNSDMREKKAFKKLFHVHMTVYRSKLLYRGLTTASVQDQDGTAVPS